MWGIQNWEKDNVPKRIQDIIIRELAKNSVSKDFFYLGYYLGSIQVALKGTQLGENFNNLIKDKITKNYIPPIKHILYKFVKDISTLYLIFNERLELILNQNNWFEQLTEETLSMFAILCNEKEMYQPILPRVRDRGLRINLKLLSWSQKIEHLSCGNESCNRSLIGSRDFKYDNDHYVVCKHCATVNSLYLS